MNENIEVKKALDELEKKVGKTELYNVCLLRAIQIKAELIPKVTRYGQSC